MSSHHHHHHRPAVVVQMSPQAYVKGLQTRAIDLEQQMDRLEKQKSDTAKERANALRTPLCETLSDILLAYPQQAVLWQVPERLWRKCFYSRIGRLRKSKHTNNAHHLNMFLAEAITLYDYLIHKLNDHLKGIREKAPPSGGASLDSSSIQTSPVTESTEGTVVALSRLFVCLGDLYRYSEKMNQATAAYTTASLLGPGLGHAYNQLAVLSQQHTDLTAMTLYWYARALLANDVFDMAHNNLQRLWAAAASQISTTPAVTVPKTSKIFLAQLVQIQHEIWSGRAVDMETFVNDFTQLLQSSSIGDNLLIKIVTILAFGEQYQAEDPSPIRPNARALTVAMANAMLERVTEVTRHKNKPCIRGLVPLLLVSEYLYLQNEPSAGFWSDMADFLNLLKDHATPNVSHLPEWKEYKSLQGFRPFEGITPELVDGLVVSDEEAISLVQDYYRPSSMPTAAAAPNNETASTSTASTADSGRLKVAHFFQQAETWTNKIVRNESGEFVATVGHEYDNAVTMMMEDDDEPESSATQNPEEDACANLVYVPSASGGHMLLVPATLLTEPLPQQTALTVSTVNATTAAAAEPPKPTPPPMLPPPGFGAPVVVQQQLGGPMAVHFGQFADPMGGIDVAAHASSRAPTLLESFDLFGGSGYQHTSNPFVTSSSASATNNGTTYFSHDTWMEEWLVRPDGTALLDSSLLSSLLNGGSSPETKNPFAT